MAEVKTAGKPGFLRRLWRGEAGPWLPFWLLLVPSAIAGAALATTYGTFGLLVAVLKIPWQALLPVGLIVLAVPLAGAVMAWRGTRKFESSSGQVALRFVCLALVAVVLLPLWTVGKTWGRYAQKESAVLQKEYDAADLDGKLLLAARNGDPKQVLEFLRQGANVDARERMQPNFGRTPLHYAAGVYRAAGPRKHLEVAKLLLAKGADVNARAQGGYTPLHVASGNYGNGHVAALLLANGADVNAKDRRGTPLAAAALAGKLEVVKLLLSQGADPNVVDSNGHRPLDLIISVGTWYDRHDEIFIRILEAGASLAPPERGHSPIAAAMRRGRPKLVLAMLDKGGGADAALVEHIGSGAHREVLEALLARNVAVFTGEGVGATLLHGAACTKDVAFFDWVLANTPDVNVRAEDGSTPLHKAARCANADTTAKLLARQADVNALNTDGAAPINELHGGNTLSILRTLLDAGANPNISSKDGRTPLMGTVYVSSPVSARLLLERGANVNAKNRWGRTALHEAARLYKVEVAEVILGAKDLKVDEPNDEGETALHMVVRSGGPRLVPLLLKRGADKSLRGKDGKTALEIVESKGGPWKEIADLLR